MNELVKLFKALGNKNRLLILRYLIRTDKLTIRELASRIGLSYKSTSKHLLILETRGFIEQMKESGRVYYSIAHFNSDDVRVHLLKLIR